MAPTPQSFGATPGKTPAHPPPVGVGVGADRHCSVCRGEAGGAEGLFQSFDGRGDWLRFQVVEIYDCLTSALTPTLPFPRATVVGTAPFVVGSRHVH